jgi:hypothetical protein
MNGQPKGTGVAPLLYLLALVCGLAGITLLRLDEPRVIVPLAFGTVVGAAVGPTLALLRVRIWALLAASFGLSFCAPILLGAVYAMFGGGAAGEIAILALVASTLCGYSALQERGALLAFWYPAMLWTVVILDGHGFDGATHLPSRGEWALVIGLAGLFVAFLRARETRRVELWKRYGGVRLATPLQHTVLRTSPLRGITQLVWTSLVGGATLTITVWIAPQLWQKEKEHHERTALAVPQPVATDELSGSPCCHETHNNDRERIREYLPLFHGRDVTQRNEAPSCVVCQELREREEPHGWTYNGTPGAGLSVQPGESFVAEGYGYRYGGTPYVATSQTYDAYTMPGPYEPPFATHPPAQRAPAKSAILTTPTRPTTPTTPVHVDAAKARQKTSQDEPNTSRRVPVVDPPKAGGAPPKGGTPWAWLFSALVLGFILSVAVRPLRRALTLRHLARPLWPERVDQRVSNEWQRMLIGLRDAGIPLRASEQPQAFARRVAIEGMEACATVLERVRHGVRIDSTDLVSMHAAASAVYRVSRERAGLPARIVAWFRWPLV